MHVVQRRVPPYCVLQQLGSQRIWHSVTFANTTHAKSWNTTHVPGHSRTELNTFLNQQIHYQNTHQRVQFDGIKQKLEEKEHLKLNLNYLKYMFFLSFSRFSPQVFVGNFGLHDLGIIVTPPIVLWPQYVFEGLARPSKHNLSQGGKYAAVYNLHLIGIMYNHL